MNGRRTLKQIFKNFSDDEVFEGFVEHAEDDKLEGYFYPQGTDTVLIITGNILMVQCYALGSTAFLKNHGFTLESDKYLGGNINREQIFIPPPEDSNPQQKDIPVDGERKPVMA